MRTRTLCLLTLFGLLVAACGGDDDTDDAGGAEDPSAQSADGDGSSGDGEADDTDLDGQQGEDAGEDTANEPSAGNATVTLDNGESFTSEVRCDLEGGASVGGETRDFQIVTTSGDTAIAIDSLGGDVVMTVTANATREQLYRAGAEIGAVDLTNDGSSLTGTAEFIIVKDPAADLVPGEIDIQC